MHRRKRKTRRSITHEGTFRDPHRREHHEHGRLRHLRSRHHAREPEAAIGGETGASAKYAAFAQAAKEQGYEQIARLFEARPLPSRSTSASSTRSSRDGAGLREAAAPEAEGIQTDLNLIMGAQGEIFETSDMYPAFIKKAQEEGNTKAVQVFTRAKLAESVHAERYLAAYNDIDAPDDDKFYLCPICGYIHKGENFEKCPICFCPKASFRAF